MVKRLCKTVLLGLIHSERVSLVNLLNSIPHRKATGRGVDSLDWSCQDVVSQLFDWGRVIDWYEAAVAGDKPAVPGDGFQWSLRRQLNELIYRRHCRKSSAEMRKRFTAVHKRTLFNQHCVTEEQVITLNFSSWIGQSWTVSDYFRANTASQYKWAREEVTKWLKTLDS